MHISLTKDDVVVAADFDFVAILGTEQNLIARFHGTNIRADGHDFGPHQALANLCRCRNEYSAGGTALAFRPAEVDENAIVQHLDGEFLAVGANAVGKSIGGLR